MDNYTLLLLLSLTLGINLIYTLSVTEYSDKNTIVKWRTSSLSLFLGFSLLLFQAVLPPFVSIIIANFLLLMGFFLQVETAVNFEYGKKLYSHWELLILSVIYMILFCYLTYWHFETSQRIIVISVFLTLIYGYGAFLLIRRFQTKRKEVRKTREVAVIFLLASLFYLFRIIVTYGGSGAVSSLYDPNVVTSMSLIAVIVICNSYMLGIYKAFVRHEKAQALRQKDRIGYLFDFLSNTARHLDLLEVYETIEETLWKSLHVEAAAIYMKDDEDDGHAIAHVFNEIDLPIDEIQRFKKGQGISGTAIELDRVVEIDIDSYPNKKVVEAYKARGRVKLVSLPLKSPAGIIGAISVAYGEAERDNIIDREFFYHLGEQIGLVLHNALLYRRIALMAHTDYLTDLLNRRRLREIFLSEQKRARRSNLAFSIAMADLDDFKNINDTYGHDCGDLVLKNAAAVFKRVCRETDRIARWGGEEFLFLFIDSDLEAAQTVAERIREEFENGTLPCSIKKPVTISLGLTGFSPDLTIDELIKQADKALYEAKRKGKNRVEVFSG